MTYIEGIPPDYQGEPSINLILYEGEDAVLIYVNPITFQRLRLILTEENIRALLTKCQDVLQQMEGRK